jgi:hypothetical protein
MLRYPGPPLLSIGYNLQILLIFWYIPSRKSGNTVHYHSIVIFLLRFLCTFYTYFHRFLFQVVPLVLWSIAANFLLISSWNWINDSRNHTLFKQCRPRTLGHLQFCIDTMKKDRVIRIDITPQYNQKLSNSPTPGSISIKDVCCTIRSLLRHLVPRAKFASWVEGVEVASSHAKGVVEGEPSSIPWCSYLSN